MSGGTDRLWVLTGRAGEWQVMRIVALTDRDATLTANDGSIVTVPLSTTARWAASHATDHDDVGTMDDLHEAPLLELLRRRFDASRIYTWSGDVLISVNPFQPINGMYDLPYAPVNEWRERRAVAGAEAKIDTPRADEPPPPHVFSVAERAWRRLLDEGDAQARTSRRMCGF